jgi:type VI secretion system protein ImpA
MPVDADLIANCLQPISGDAPAGSDLRYDVRMDEIKEARREESFPGSDRKTADWNSVVALCTKLLQKETKDLQLAAWLTEALLNRQGFGGLASGLTLVQGFIEQFWDGVYPLPEDGDLELRVAPVEWLAQRLAIPIRLVPVIGRFSSADVALSAGVPTEEDAAESREKSALRNGFIEEGRATPEDVSAAQHALGKVQIRALLAEIAAAKTAGESLASLCDARFTDLAPSFRPLFTALDEPQRLLSALLARKLEEDPDPEVISEAGDEDTPATAGAAEADGPLTPDPVSAADAARRVGSVAKWLRADNSTNPAAYLLLRGLRWGELREHAPDLDPRLLEAPPTAMRTRLKSLALEGKWPLVLELAETVMATTAGRGWLDLQRYAMAACRQLGDSHAAVADALRTELRALLHVFPTLPTMTLMDDTPTANDETREWLKNDILAEDTSSDSAADAGDGDGGEEPAPSDGSELVEEALTDDASTAWSGGFSRQRRTVHPTRRIERDVFAVAMAEASQGRAQRAIELLTAELTRERSPRGRFLRQTQIAYVMVESGLDAVASPILQRLVEVIDERSLEEWEAGPLVAQPLALLHKLLTRAGDDSERAADLYLRICRLDPIQALALTR